MEATAGTIPDGVAAPLQTPGLTEAAPALLRSTEAHDSDPRVNPFAPPDRAPADHSTEAQRQDAAEEFKPDWAVPGETMTAVDVIEQAVAAAEADLAEAHKKHLAAFRDAAAEATRLPSGCKRARPARLRSSIRQGARGATPVMIARTRGTQAKQCVPGRKPARMFPSGMGRQQRHTLVRLARHGFRWGAVGTRQPMLRDSHAREH